MSNHRKRMETYHNLLQMPERISRSLSSTRSGFVVNMYLVGIVIFGLFFLPLALAYWVFVVFPLRFSGLISVVIYGLYVVSIGGAFALYNAEVQRNRVELITTFYSDTVAQTPILYLDFSADGAYLASATLYRIQVWDLSRQQMVAQIRAPEDYYFSEIAVSPDGTQVASAYQPHTIFLWDVATGDQIARLDCSAECKRIDDVIFSPDGMTLVSSTPPASLPREIHVWSHDHHLTEGPNYSDSSDLVFSPDSTVLAYGTNRLAIQLWNLATNEIEAVLQSDNTRGTGALAFSPDGALLAAQKVGSIIEIWDIESEEVLTVLDNTSVLDMAFTADGSKLAGLVFGDRVVRLWDVYTGEIVADRKWYVDDVHITFSPDGTLLASDNRYGEIRIWNVPGLAESKNSAE